MTAEELDAEKDRFDAVVNGFIERCTQEAAQVSKEEALTLHSRLWDAFGVYAEALRQRGHRIESREVGEAYFSEASKLTHESFMCLFVSLMRYHNSRNRP